MLCCSMSLSWRVRRTDAIILRIVWSMATVNTFSSVNQMKSTSLFEFFQVWTSMKCDDLTCVYKKLLRYCKRCNRKWLNLSRGSAVSHFQTWWEIGHEFYCNFHGENDCERILKIDSICKIYGCVYSRTFVTHSVECSAFIMLLKKPWNIDVCRHEY